jgi:hypothetical protein
MSEKIQTTEKLKTGTVVFIPATKLEFNTELIERCSVFDDQGDIALIVITPNGSLKLTNRGIVFVNIDDAKRYYLNWLNGVAEKLETTWFAKEKTDTAEK